MQSHKVEYYRTAAIVAILVLVPLFFTGIFLIAVLAIKDMPDWLLILSVCFLMLVSIAGTLIMYKRYGTLPCEVEMNEQGLSVKLLRHSFLYSVSHYSSNWDNVGNVSTNYDPNHHRRFYQVTFKTPKITINLIPTEKVEHEQHETEFGKTLMSFVEGYNEQHRQEPTMQIHSRGFYTTTFAKILTFLAWVMTIGVIVVKISAPDKISIWRVLAILTYSGLWLSAYYINRQRK